MSKGFFVTGTDTGVGKTAISAGLAYCLKRRGIKVAVMKPVQTGGVSEGGRLISEDLQVLLQGVRLNEPLELLNPYCLPEPCSPHLAARLAGLEIEPGKIINAYRQLADCYEVVIVEGAGGLLVPLREDYLTADLVKELELPLLIVANNILGVINHAALTVECALLRGLKVLGTLLNHTEFSPPNPIQRDNPAIISKITEAPFLGTVPYRPHEENWVQSIATLLEETLVVDSLLLELELRDNAYAHGPDQP